MKTHKSTATPQALGAPDSVVVGFIISSARVNCHRVALFRLPPSRLLLVGVNEILGISKKTCLMGKVYGATRPMDRSLKRGV